MKIATLLLAASLMLTGCYQTVNISDIRDATTICARYGTEVVEISSTFVGSESVTCTDRSIYMINSQNLKGTK